MRVPDGRNRQGNIDPPAVFAKTDSLEMVDPLATLQAAEDLGLFAEAIRRNDNCDGFADDLLGGVTKQPLCTAVPSG